MKKLIVVFLIVALVITFAACGGGSKGGGGKKGDPVRIGGLFDYTGPVADAGPKFEAGVRLAIENANGEINGRPIELVIADSATDVTTAVEKFKDLADKEGLEVVIGPLMGDSQLAISPIAKEKNVIFTGLIGGMWQNVEDRHCIIYPSTCDAMTYPLGPWAYEQGYRTMATIGANFAGKIAFVEGVIKGFEDAGGKVETIVWSDLGTEDFSGYLATLPKDVDVLLYALEGPAAVSRFVYQAREANFTVPMITITQDSDYIPEVLQELGEVALGIPGQGSYTWQLDNPENKAFVEGIKKFNKGMIPTSIEQNSFALATAIIEALKITGGDTSYDKLWPAITGLDLNTPAGRLTFGPEGIAVTDFYITEAEQASDGTYQLSAPLYSVPQIKDWRLN